MARDPGQFWPLPWPGENLSTTDVNTIVTTQLIPIAGAINGGGLYIPRGTPNAQDDAFLGPTLDPKWTKQNWSTIAEEVGTDSGSLTFKLLASAGDNLRMISQPLVSPTGNYDYCVWAHLNGADTNAQFVGIGLRESSSGKVQGAFVTRRGGAPLYSIKVAAYTNNTTFNTDSGTAIDLTSYLNMRMMGGVLLRVKKESTTLRFYACFGFGGGDATTGGGDRGPWIELDAPAENTRFTTRPDQVVLIAGATNSTTPFATFRLFRKRA